MSGPFYVSMTVISGQEFSGEIAVAAATFLSMNYLYVSVVSPDSHIRPEFLSALEIFEDREGIYYDTRPTKFVERLAESNNIASIKALFWLALDIEGEGLAKKILDENGELPEKKVYKSVRKLNLIEPNISPPPPIQQTLGIWENTRHKHFSLSLDYHKLKVEESRQSFMSHHAPLTPEEELWINWCKALYESLIPWKDTIKDIQSDWS